MPQLQTRLSCELCPVSCHAKFPAKLPAKLAFVPSPWASSLVPTSLARPSGCRQWPADSVDIDQTFKISISSISLFQLARYSIQKCAHLTKCQATRYWLERAGMRSCPVGSHITTSAECGEAYKQLKQMFRYPNRRGLIEFLNPGWEGVPRRGVACFC